MKILFLNPRIDAEHNLIKALQEKGMSFLFPVDESEAWQALRWHGMSIDLAILHREGIDTSQDPGIRLISKIKSDPTHRDLPIILTTEAWSDADCAKHQSQPEGVNAYLHTPLDANSLISVIQQVLGSEIKSQTEQAPPVPDFQVDPNAPVLEEASGIFLQSSDVSDPSIPGIQLSVPDDPVIERIGTLQLDQNENQGSLLPSEASVDISRIDLAELEASKLSEPLPEVQVESAPTLTVAPEEVSPEINSDPAKSSEVNFDLPDMSRLVLGNSEQPSSGQNESNDEPGLSLSDAPQLSPSSQESAVSAGLIDEEVKQEMPYLFQDSQKPQKHRIDPSLLFAQALGDAVVPGGAAQSPDLETIKKYLFLREQDVAVLSNRIKASQDQIEMLEQILREEKAKNAELTHLAQEQKRKVDDFEREKSILEERLNSEISELRFQVKAKTDKAKVLELQVNEISESMDRLKERVRTDIRKIRVREKELENRIEVMKKDSEALIGARESKIIELKRKLDLLEFNMDLLQDQYAREKENSLKLKERLIKAAQVVRVAGGLLDSKKAAAIKDILPDEEENLGSESESRQAS